MSPFFVSFKKGKMISNSEIKEALDRTLDKDKYFIVRIHNKGENIKVILDGYQKFNIDDCVNISRELKSELGDELSDYNLEVTSPGLTAPFEVKEQYEKHKGEKVEVLLKDGTKIKGKLLNIFPESIEIEEKKRIKTENKKKKTVVENKNIKLDSIKSTKLIISF
jgi:ribosome maturation factor RimP